MTIPTLRRVARREYVNQLWQATLTLPAGRTGCPMCHNGMAVVENMLDHETGALAMEIDVCRCCQTVWFDTHEAEEVLARVPVEVVAEEAPKELPQKAREIIALAEIERIRERANTEDAYTPPDEGWQTILTVFGFPVEDNAPGLSRWPFVTWSVVLLMTLATVLMMWLGGQKIVDEWGFVPADPWRANGLTFFTAFFLHAGWIHLVGNAVFLLIFGDNVEDYLGHLRYVVLLFGAALAGDLLHGAFEVRSTLPSVGASGGIAGVITFYALQFPKARLVYFIRWGFFLRWVRFSAWIGFAIWLGTQLLGLWQQHQGLSNVSALAHLGGAAFGVLFWLIVKASADWAGGPSEENSKYNPI